MGARPLYETEADRTAEAQVAYTLAAQLGCIAERTPRAYQIDWLLMRRNLDSFVEIKRRQVPHNRYPTLMLSAHKWDYGRSMAERFDVGFYLAIEYTDGIYYWRTKDIKPEVRIGGRSDRGDDQDMEPVVHLPIELFAKLDMARYSRQLAPAGHG